MYDAYAERCDAVYIGFSGGKDSVVLLDLCHKVLPLDVPVVFSDTDMELPDTYHVWNEIQSRYEGRPFLKVSAKNPALDNWRLFGPPVASVALVLFRPQERTRDFGHSKKGSARGQLRRWHLSGCAARRAYGD